MRQTIGKVLLLLTLAFCSTCAYGAVAFDQFSNAAAEFTTDAGGTWTHTPVGTPMAVICFVVRASGSGGATDSVDGITYGGAAMTEMSGSPILQNGADDDVNVWGFFKGSSIATGAQSVVVDVNTAVGHHAGCATLTASSNTEIVDVDATTNSESDDNPEVTLSLGGRTCFVMIGFGSGQGVTSGITARSGWTNRLENDFGAATGGIYTYNTVSTADVTAGFDQTADNVVMIAVAVSEVPATGANPVIGGGVCAGGGTVC